MSYEMPWPARIRSALWDAWTRLCFFFRPTYHVFSSVDVALKYLSDKGGTLVMGPGEHRFSGVLPDKPVRILGGHINTGADGLQISLDGRKTPGCKYVFENCVFIGTPKRSPAFVLYSDLSRVVEQFEQLGDDSRADTIRDLMDPVWDRMTDEERKLLGEN